MAERDLGIDQKVQDAEMINQGLQADLDPEVIAVNRPGDDVESDPDNSQKELQTKVIGELEAKKEELTKLNASKLEEVERTKAKLAAELRQKEEERQRKDKEREERSVKRQAAVAEKEKRLRDKLTQSKAMLQKAQELIQK